jgi:hypothetical protein
MPMKATTNSTRNKRNKPLRLQRLEGARMSRSTSARPTDDREQDDAQASMLAELEALVKLGRLVLHK